MALAGWFCAALLAAHGYAVAKQEASWKNCYELCRQLANEQLALIRDLTCSIKSKEKPKKEYIN
jgi:hypothetical protein